MGTSACAGMVNGVVDGGAFVGLSLSWDAHP